MKPRFQQVLIGGFAGTILMTLFLYYVAPLMGAPVDIAAVLAGLIATGWLAGMVIHILLGGLAFPVIFHGLYPMLPGAGWLKGLIFGMILAVIFLVIVMPLAGLGMFMAEHPQPGMAVMVFLLGYAVYGIVLGWWSAKSVGRDAPATRTEPAATA